MKSIKFDYGGSNEELNLTSLSSGVLTIPANSSVDLQCLVFDGFPPPIVDIFLDSKNITDQFQFRNQYNYTGDRVFRKTTVLSIRYAAGFFVRSMDHGKTLTCSATVASLQAVFTKLKLYILRECLQYDVTSYFLEGGALMDAGLRGIHWCYRITIHYCWLCVL